MSSPHNAEGSSLVRRLALAVPVSILVHLALALLTRPEYRPVADFAVDMEVMQAAPGPPPRPAEEQPAKAPQEPAPEPVPEKPKPKKQPRPSRDAVVLEEKETETTGADAGPVRFQVAAAGSDAGVDGGTGGICMHDLFGFTRPDANWILWLSVASFRDTAFEAEIARFLATYRLGRRIAESTGITPEKEVAGLLISTNNLFDWQAYRTVVSHDASESGIRRALDASQGQAGPLAWSRTDHGLEASAPGAFRWSLVGSGRALVVDGERTGVVEAIRSTQGPQTVDAGRRSDATEPWPTELSCLSWAPEPAPQSEEQATQSEALVREARAFLSPDPDGHWPVALLATTDPRALGLRLRRTGLTFGLAVIRIYFTDPVQIQGTLRFRGPADRVAALKTYFQKLAAQATADPFLNLLGLSHLFVNLDLAAEGESIAFAARISENQAKAALLFLTMQAEALERYMNEKP